MFELLEKAALTALGMASLTQKRGEELIQEMKERYKMSEEEGRAILDRLQEIARMGKERSAEMAEAEVRRVLELAGAVPREEFERLKRRVEALETLQATQAVSSAQLRDIEEEPGPEC